MKDAGASAAVCLGAITPPRSAALAAFGREARRASRRASKRQKCEFERPLRK